MTSILLTSAMVAGLVSAPAASAQPDLPRRGAPEITVDGLRFRDLDRDGRLTPYEDWRLSAEARASDLARRMTTPEKAGLMMHAAHSGFFGAGGVVLDALAPPPPGALRSPVNVTGVPGFDRSDKPSPRNLIQIQNVRWINTSPGGTPADAARWANALQDMAADTRLGVPVMLTADPVQTTNRMPGGALPPPDRRKITSSWPDQIGLAATGDPSLVRRFGEVAAAEYRALGFRMILNPMVDLSTEPRWNRIPGTFGEDASTSGALAADYVRGFQGESLSSSSVLTMLKHFPGDGPVKDGLDPHNLYGQHLVFPGGKLDYHLQPFRDGLAAGAAAVMTSYGIPDGIDTVGSSFSKPVVTGLLRNQMGFDGIVVSDWLHAMPWGVETLSKGEREALMVDAGIDQFGGEHQTSYLIQAVNDGRISQARLTESARRILKPMFAIGLFENPYVDPQAAARIVASPAFNALGEEAQRRSIVLLRNENAVLPLKPTDRVLLRGFGHPPAVLAGRTVEAAADADVVIVKINAPYTVNKTGESFFTNTHEGPLIYTGSDNEAELRAVEAAVATGKPVVVAVSMERPAVLSEFIDDTAAVLATFGSGDDALAAILTGDAAPQARLPFDLPADQASVESQKADTPFDFPHTLFRHGFGLSYR